MIKDLLPFLNGWDTNVYKDSVVLSAGDEKRITMDEQHGYLVLAVITATGNISVQLSGFVPPLSFSVQDLLNQRRIFPDVVYLSQSEPPYTVVITGLLPFRRASITIQAEEDATVSYTVNTVEVYDPEEFTRGLRSFMGATVLAREVREFYKEEEIPLLLVEVLRRLQESVEELIAPAVIRVK